MILRYNRHDHSWVGGWHSELAVYQDGVGLEVLLDSVVLKNVSVISPTAGSFVMPSARVESCEFGDILNLKCWAAANLI